MKKIVCITGSLRKDSFNTKLLKKIAEVGAEQASFEIITPGDIPLFNADLEANFPASVTEYKQKITDADTVIISTPEYNRSMSGVLKNFIDWTSRPYGKSVWKDKRVLLSSVSTGKISGAVAYYSLVTTLSHLGADIVNPESAELMFGNAGDVFDDEKPLPEFAQAAIERGLSFLV